MTEDELRDVFRPDTVDVIAFVGLTLVVFFGGFAVGLIVGKFL